MRGIAAWLMNAVLVPCETIHTISYMDMPPLRADLPRLGRAHRAREDDDPTIRQQGRRQCLWRENAVGKSCILGTRNASLVSQFPQRRATKL